MKAQYFTILVSIFFQTSGLAKGMDINDIIRIARQNAPDIKLVEESYQAGNYEARGYLAQALPRADFTYSMSRADQLASPTTGGTGAGSRFELDTYSWTLQLTSPLYTFGRVGALYNMYSTQSDKVQLERSYNNDLALIGVIRSYVDALSASKNKDVLAKALDSAKKTSSFTDLEFRGGAIKKVDHMLSKARYEMAEASFIQARSQANDRLQKLKIALGMKASDPLKLELNNIKVGNYFKTPPHKDRKVSKPLQISELNKQFAMSNREYRGAEYYPSLNVFAQASGSSYKITDPITMDGGFSDSFKDDNRSTSYGISLSWNLLAGGGDYANHRVAIAQANQAQIDYDRNRLLEEVDKKGAKDQLEAARKIYTASNRSLKANRLAFASSDVEFRNGEISLTEFIRREEELLAAEKDAIDAFGGLVLAIAEYRIKTGREIR